MNYAEVEPGVISIPSSEWRRIKKTVRNAWNDLQKRAHRVALKVWKDIENGTPYKEALRTHCAGDRRVVQPGSAAALPVEVEWKIRDSIMRGRHGRTVSKPRAKDFPRKEKGDTLFIRGDWAIRFNDETNALIWVIWDGNEGETVRARVRRDPVVQSFFKAMESIEWTRP